MNNSRANACSPWKCKQPAARTARWTRQSPEKWEDFCFHYYYFLLLSPDIYSNEICVTGPRFMENAPVYANYHLAVDLCPFLNSPPPALRVNTQSHQCFRLYLSVEAAETACHGWVWRWRWEIAWALWYPLWWMKRRVTAEPHQLRFIFNFHQLHSGVSSQWGVLPQREVNIGAPTI